MLLARRVNSLETMPFNARNEPADNVRTRRSVGGASSFPVGAMFSGSVVKKLRLSGDLPNYLKVSPDSNSLSVGSYGDDESQVCFKMHSFHLLLPSNEGGDVVTIETQDGRYITKDPANPENVTLTTGNAPEQTVSTDDRFFRISGDPGDQYVNLKHLHSGTYLSATESGVSLHSGTGDLPDSTLFKEFLCAST